MTIRAQRRIPGATHRVFWERKASEYPSPFEKRIHAWSGRVMEVLEKRGVPTAGARVLDIGCGTGTFALRFALGGAFVTALDFSANMLKRLAAEAERIGVEGMRTVRCSWRSMDVRGAGLESAFDVVLSSLSTAVQSEEDIVKMEGCSTGWCVYVASGKTRRTRACTDVLLALGAPLDPRPDVREMERTLTNMGRKFTCESFVTTMKYRRSLEEIVKELSGRLEASGTRPDGEMIRDVVLRSCAGRSRGNEAIEYRRRFDTGILIWRAGED